MLARLRNLHPGAKLVSLIVLLLFVWLNLDFTRDVYNEQIQNGWRGGIRCGFPLNCWDAGQATTMMSAKGLLDLRMTPYGGIQWLGLAADLLALFAALFAIAYLSELVRARLTAGKPTTARTHRRMHPASYATALCVTALLLWVNAQYEIKKVSREGRIEFLQTRGWPLKVYAASRPAEIEFRKAKALALDMLAYLESKPDAWYRIVHWEQQNITWNLLICMSLIILSASISESILARRRALAAAPVSI